MPALTPSRLAAVLLTWTLIPLLAPPPSTAQESGLATEPERLGYAIGLNSARSLRDQGVPVDVEALLQGIRDGFSDAPAKLTDEELQALLEDLQRRIVEQRQQRRAELGEEIRARGEEFLARNRTRPEVVTLDSGLQYEVLAEGSGPSPAAGSRVRIHYTASLLDGTVFDNSRERGEPAVLSLDAVIPGWQEAVPRMKVGDRWKLYVPPDLAYGETGVPGRIPPNAVLVFDVELLGIDS